MVVESIYLDNPSDDVTLALWTVNFATHAYILPVCVYIYIYILYTYICTAQHACRICSLSGSTLQRHCGWLAIYT